MTAVIAAAAAGYLLGRVRLWQRLGDWAEGEISFARWERGGRARRIAVTLIYSLTRPLASWRIVCHGPRSPCLSALDPDWAAKRTAPVEPSPNPAEVQRA
ncbi:hypothetical protein ACWD4T_00640 [Streptomyces umbrinus]